MRVGECNMTRLMSSKLQTDFSFTLPDISHTIFVLFTHKLISRSDNNIESHAINPIEPVMSYDCAFPPPDSPIDLSKHQIIGQ